VRATVAALAGALDPDRDLVVARELTKLHESVARVRLGDACAWLDADANRVRGEFVLVVDAPRAAAAEALSPEALAWLDALAGELPPARAAKIVAERTGAPRDALYARAMERKDRG
jgi:16S rRNA (cytidine1402-2'-O)-methyltransferase